MNSYLCTSTTSTQASRITANSHAEAAEKYYDGRKGGVKEPIIVFDMSYDGQRFRIEEQREIVKLPPKVKPPS